MSQSFLYKLMIVTVKLAMIIVTNLRFDSGDSFEIVI